MLVALNVVTVRRFSQPKHAQGGYLSSAQLLFTTAGEELSDNCASEKDSGNRTVKLLINNGDEEREILAQQAAAFSFTATFSCDAFSSTC